MPNKEAKKAGKAIKLAQKGLISTVKLEKTDELSPKKALARLPSKRQKVEKPLLDATTKGMELKKKAKTAKHSKRTSPKVVANKDNESDPQSIHMVSEKAIRQGETRILHKRDLMAKKLPVRKKK